MTREKAKEYGKKYGRIGGYGCLMLAPVFSYLLFEWVTGNLGTVPWYMAALNIGWNYVLYLVVLGISGSSRIAVPVISISLLIASLAEAFVVAFRERPVMFWDVLALPTAMTVSGTYKYVLTTAMKGAVLAVVLLNVITWFTPIRARGWKKRLKLGAGCGAFSAVYSLIFFLYFMPAWDLGINMWAVNESYQHYGYVLATAISSRYIVRRPPAGYSAGAVERIYEELAAEYGENRTALSSDAEEGAGAEGAGADENAQTADGAAIQPVNILCIMNESLSDLRVAGDFTTNMEYFPFLDSLTENTVRGSLCVPVFGSMTSNSEFEFLMGDSMVMLPTHTIAYQFNVKPDTASLVTTLKDQGYYALAMHPYPGANWNRNQVYANLGFDEFLDQDYYEGCETLRTYVSDRADYEKLIEQVEAKENPEDKLFIFNVTMQNHGGYEGTFEEFPQEVYLTGALEGKYPKADQYLSLMKKSDEALEYLLDYFSQCEEPTMIVVFGDHQPSVEDAFYDEIAGVPSSLVPDEERLMWYETPFIIWTNYEQPSKDVGRLGAVYLSSYVLRQANLESPLYNQFLYNLSQDVPVIHTIGLYDKEGNYYTWEEAEAGACPCSEAIMKYEYMAYNHSMDSRKVDELFSLLPGQL